MKAFEYVQPQSLQEAITFLDEDAQQSQLLAGGLDLLGEMKEHVREPNRLVGISKLSELSHINFANDKLSLGAAVTLTDIAEHAEIQENYPALAQAALSVGSQQIRNRGTLGGNLCQRPRCWYYRDEHYDCLKKGGGTCFSVNGRNRYHAILSGGPCFIVHPSDCAPALIALGANIHIFGSNGERELPLEELYLLPTQAMTRETILQPNEIVTQVVIPKQNRKSSYVKLKEKESFDWALASVAVALEMREGQCVKAHIVLGGVAPKPWRATQAEAMLAGQTITEALAQEAAEAAVASAAPLKENKYKVNIVKALIADSLTKFKGGDSGVKDMFLY